MFNKYSYQLISAVNHADFALLSIRFKHMKIRLLNSRIILLFVVLSMVLGIVGNICMIHSIQNKVVNSIQSNELGVP